MGDILKMVIPMNQRLIETIVPILKEHGVKHASIFGSFAKGKEKPHSDLDLFVELPQTFSLLDHVALERKLGEAIHRKVDIVSTRTKLHPIIKNRILSQKLPIL